MHSLLVDFNNIAMSKLFSKAVMEKQGYEVKNIDYLSWKEQVFSAIYGYFSKYKNTNEIVLAIDYHKSWRKLYFPRYKEHRQKTKDKFNIDWKEYNAVFYEFIHDLKRHFPFKILNIQFAEGDDVIGVIVLNRKNRSYTIISSDQDYLQLCRKGVKLFSIKKQQEMDHPNPEMFLKESSLIGQPKDNIFNVLTPLNYPDELRKPPMGKKKSEKFLTEGLNKSLDKNIEYKRKYINEEGNTINYNAEINLQKRYDFNRNLMDFSKIPDSIKEKILISYDNYVYPEPEKIYKFFEKHKWPWFLDNFVHVENNLLKLYKSERK